MTNSVLSLEKLHLKQSEGGTLPLNASHWEFSSPSFKNSGSIPEADLIILDVLGKEILSANLKSFLLVTFSLLKRKSNCRWGDSNSRPTDYESVALPPEPHRHVILIYITIYIIQRNLLIISSVKPEQEHAPPKSGVVIPALRVSNNAVFILNPASVSPI